MSEERSDMSRLSQSTRSRLQRWNEEDYRRFWRFLSCCTICMLAIKCSTYCWSENFTSNWWAWRYDQWRLEAIAFASSLLCCPWTTDIHDWQKSRIYAKDFFKCTALLTVQRLPIYSFMKPLTSYSPSLKHLQFAVRAIILVHFSAYNQSSPIMQSARESYTIALR